eukprot:GHUV01008373.1.p1 GENE.GHUV01008373.1~~GHUV01008373.1.p1  ORF type:complete len:219 (-),score=39.81 GHUV01008373.1:123-779(-)
MMAAINMPPPAEMYVRRTTPLTLPFSRASTPVRLRLASAANRTILRAEGAGPPMLATRKLAPKTLPADAGSESGRCVVLLVLSTLPPVLLRLLPCSTSTVLFTLLPGVRAPPLKPCSACRLLADAGLASVSAVAAPAESCCTGPATTAVTCTRGVLLAEDLLLLAAASAAALLLGLPDSAPQLSCSLPNCWSSESSAAAAVQSSCPSTSLPLASPSVS